MNERKRLNSWKEIAAHLQIETRTAMRWENDRGLPVHRVPGGKRQAVFAYAEELDAWLHGQLAGDLRDDAAATNGVSDAVRYEDRRGSKLEIRNRWLAIALVSALAMVALLAVVFSAVVQRTGIGGEVVRVSFAGEKLIAWDAAGREAWSHEFPGRMQDPKAGIWNGVSELARLVDVDGDGQREVLAAVHLPTGPGREDPHYGELYCFSAQGQLRWRYRPENVLKFRDREFTGPWIIYDYLVSTEGTRRTIWLAVNHHMWWPAFLVKLDSAGHGTVQFVNSGTIFTLGSAVSGSQKYLLAGGVNNEPYAGMMAVLDVNQPAATSPQTKGSEFECKNCPAGKPASYFVFPPTELNQFDASRLNRVNSLLRVNQGVEAVTMEVNPSALVLYELSTQREILPVGLRFSDGFRVLHQQLVKEGRLKHTFERCPERTRPKVIRMWTAAHGWEDVVVSTSRIGQ